MTNIPSHEDEQYLRLLSIFHFVVAGIAALFACFPIFHFTIGVGMLVSSLTQPEETGPMALFGLVFAGLAGTIMLVGWAFAGCVAVAGWYLSLRKNYLYCLVMAAVECMFTPFGTVLGVFTLIVLMRPSVKALFSYGTTALAGSPP
jgi:hypothetical protein